MNVIKASAIRFVLGFRGVVNEYFYDFLGATGLYLSSWGIWRINQEAALIYAGLVMIAVGIAAAFARMRARNVP